MRRGLPRREYVFLSLWYEDYMWKKYGSNVPDEGPTEEEILADAPWGAETITGGPT